MLRATSIIRKAAVKEDRVADTAWLDHSARRGQNEIVTSHGGLEFMIAVDLGTTLNDGDALKLEDGGLVRVRAAPERLLEIRAENPLRLIRLAWHLGQEHEPAEFKADAIYVGSGHALAELARRQGCSVTEVTRPFHPERPEHVCEHHDHHGHHQHGHTDPGHDHDDYHGHGGHGHSHGHGDKPEH
jgi:urease accessory protein